MVCEPLIQREPGSIFSHPSSLFSGLRLSKGLYFMQLLSMVLVKSHTVAISILRSRVQVRALHQTCHHDRIKLRECAVASDWPLEERCAHRIHSRSVPG